MAIAIIGMLDEREEDLRLLKGRTNKTWVSGLHS